MGNPGAGDAIRPGGAGGALCADQQAAGRAARGASARGGRGNALPGYCEGAGCADRHRDVPAQTSAREAAGDDRRRLFLAAQGGEMKEAPPVTGDDLHAYADGQLSPERAAQVGGALDREPALAAHLTDIRQQNARLRAALDPWLNEALPRELVDAAQPPRSWRDRRVRRAWPVIVLAAAASLFVGIGLGWQLRSEMLEQAGTPVTFPREAAFTHALYAADANRPVEIWANEEERMVRWLSKRLSFPLRAPNLNDVGFALVGGRLVAGNEKPGALFMYENADKQRISLLVRKDDERTRETAFRYAYEDGVGVFYWIDDACGYALSGKLERAQLLSVARLVYGQLAPSDVAAPK